MSFHEPFLHGLGALHGAGVALILAVTAVVVVLTRRLGLGIERDVVIAVLRGAVQLALIALIILAVVESDHIVWTGLVLVVMAVVAGWTASVRAKRPGAFPLATMLIAGVALVLVAPLVHLGPFEAFPLFLIPVSGMVLGNAMNATALGLDRMDRELRLTLPLVEARLALGARPTRAVRPALRETTRTAMLPLLNTLKTTGIVHIPGMMTGMLIAGASPVAAAEMQFVIILVLLAASFLSAAGMALWLRARFLADLDAGRTDRWQVDEALET